MKKFIKTLLLLSALALTVAGCSDEGDVKTYNTESSGLVRLCMHIVDDSYTTFIRDTYTDNIYMKVWEKHGYGGGVSMVPYYNAKGEIMKYSEFQTVHKH